MKGFGCNWIFEMISHGYDSFEYGADTTHIHVPDKCYYADTQNAFRIGRSRRFVLLGYQSRRSAYIYGKLHNVYYVYVLIHAYI